MSSTSTSTSLEQSTVALPTTTTFLPVLDDLLSPDFRPVTLPPIPTPLQTPTAAAAATNNTAVPPPPHVNGSIDKGEAASRIQKWWKGNRNREGPCEGDAERDLRHRIRHKRTDEYIRHLECEMTRLKQTLTAERKLRSLQFEAIRSLWSQVQKITANNIDQPLMMTQSLPNGLPCDPAPKQSAPPPPCTCTTEITELKQKLESELGDLRKLVGQLLVQQQSAVAVNSSSEESTPAGKVVVNKRPDTLDLGGSGNGKHGELQGYADSVARSVVHEGVAGGGGDSKTDSKPDVVANKNDNST